MIRGALETFPDLPDDAFVHAHQANFETIHTHDVEAERSGSVGEIREEMRDGTQVARHTTLRAWLDGGVPRGADG
jgi:GTP cyclohydrolase I/GTP cyclohydrolase-4